MYAAYTPYTPYSVLYHSLILTPARVYPLTLGSAPLPWNKGEPWCIVSGKSWRPFSFFFVFFEFLFFPLLPFPFSAHTAQLSAIEHTLYGVHWGHYLLFGSGLLLFLSFSFLVSSLLEVVGLTKYMESYSSNFFTFDSDPGVHYQCTLVHSCLRV